MINVLTEDDVRLLLDDKSADSRAEITGRIASIYTSKNTDKNLTERERQVAEQIFRLLVRDAEVKVRASLAENLKESTSIPRDIVLTLAQDVAEVSLPILEYSKVLSDDDLLEIISSSKENSKFLAISRRKNVSETISGTLVEKGDDEVAKSLLANKSARLSETIFQQIIEQYQNNKTVMETIALYPTLPVGVADKLINLVSSSISETLKVKYQLASHPIQENIQKEVEKTRESETLGLVRAARSHSDVDKLIDQLQEGDRLTPSMILSALCQGNFDFFESSLAKLSNIPVENASTLIADRGDLGFRALYNKSGLPEAMFPAVKLLLKIVRELDVEGEQISSSHYSNRVVERILHYSEETPVDNLSYIIALIRRVAQ